MRLFIDHTKRSASELLADLSCCRQFRHISKDYHRTIIQRTATAVAKCIISYKQIKHPNPNDLCTNCGQPRSKYASGSGLCYRCYGSQGEALWVEDVFITAIEQRGFQCDACGSVNKLQSHEERRHAVILMLENIDGSVKPVLCPDCATDFKKFASRNYGKGAWRTFPERDIEKMLLAWLAQKVKVLAERKTRAA